MWDRSALVGADNVVALVAEEPSNLWDYVLIEVEPAFHRLL